MAARDGDLSRARRRCRGPRMKPEPERATPMRPMPFARSSGFVMSAMYALAVPRFAVAMPPKMRAAKSQSDAAAPREPGAEPGHRERGAGDGPDQHRAAPDAVRHAAPDRARRGTASASRPTRAAWPRTRSRRRCRAPPSRGTAGRARSRADREDGEEDGAEPRGGFHDAGAHYSGPWARARSASVDCPSDAARPRDHLSNRAGRGRTPRRLPLGPGRTLSRWASDAKPAPPTALGGAVDRLGAHGLVAHDAPALRGLLAADLELRLHERDERAARRACTRAMAASSLLEPDERRVDDGEVRRARRSRRRVERARVRPLHHDDARVDAQLVRELPVADVDRDDAAPRRAGAGSR